MIIGCGLMLSIRLQPQTLGIQIPRWMKGISFMFYSDLREKQSPMNCSLLLLHFLSFRKVASKGLHKN